MRSHCIVVPTTSLYSRRSSRVFLVLQQVIAVNVNKVAFTYHVSPSAVVSCFAVTPVKTSVSVPAHLVHCHAETTVSTKSAKGAVAILVNSVKMNTPGNVSIKNYWCLAEKYARTEQFVRSHAQKS